MNQQSAFDSKNIEQETVSETSGLLDQFNLPPAVVSFIRKNKRIIWVVAGCIALVVTVVSLYGSYRAYQEDKASSALTLALQAEGEEKQQQLQQLIGEYGSTSSALWGRIELAHLIVAEGNFAEAIGELTDIQRSVSAEDPLAPLLHYNLAVLYEKNNDLKQAIASFTELSAFKGFEKISYEAMGRIYELQGSKVKALGMYKKYIASGGDALAQQGIDPKKSMMQARINRLEN